jgi:hypothetical protein
MADPSSNPAPQQGNNTRKPRDSNVGLTEEQVRVIADRVYDMLLRDLKHEQERRRIFKSRVFRGGR